MPKLGSDVAVTRVPVQGFFVYDNTTTSTRPVVVIAPDYDGTGPYEMWRANLLATMGYAGKCCTARDRAI